MNPKYVIFTSYFARYRGANGISISLYTPKGITIPSYSDLAPTKDLLKAYKDGLINEKEYENIYNKSILFNLDPRKVAEDLNNTVLLCYEKDGFCHRHLVEKWLKFHLKDEILIRELKY